ncbi:hypothetical protein ACTL6P_17865 [Endozoicomonas acroporae]|uniref:hypothetical protein n=1 Tax=Endozoicomonas acroporae TaxID=1701104 RepID=UPI0011AF4E31|nr:hypothetical protein [Endozoicomonas acroporae]
MMIVSGVVTPQEWGDWLVNQSLDGILDGIEGFPRTAEGQKKMLPGSNTACDRAARSLCSRHIAPYNGSVPTGSMGKSMKRPLPACTDLEVVPQKLARNELSTFGKNNPPGAANNHRESRNSDVFRICFQHRMEGIIKKNRFQLLFEAQKKKSELKSKENKAKRVVENLGCCRRSLGNLMHPMEYAFKVLVHDESLRKLIELKIEIQQLTFELKQEELQKKFRARVYNQAIREMSNCAELAGGVGRAVEEFMNKQDWVELLPLDALNQKSPDDQKK